jgi:hypothetical protein
MFQRPRAAASDDLTRFDRPDAESATVGATGIDGILCYVYCASFVATGNVVRTAAFFGGAPVSGQMQQPGPGGKKIPGGA